MSKGDNRLKILYILDELKQNSKQNADNEEKFMSATELINALNEKYNMNADRKSVYSYIESLIKFGYDIKKTRRGYYLVEHYDRDEADAKFELPELKMIVDALSSSKFISAKKTNYIIQKLARLTDTNGNQLEQRKLYFEKAIKSDNNSVIYSIDSIYSAIMNNEQISFRYQKMEVDFNSPDEKLVAVTKTYDGKEKIYTQSPYALIWKNEYYYLLCYDSESDSAKTFRVDRMKDVELLDNVKREGAKFFEEINISEYANTAFSMYGGETINVILRVKKSLAGVIADRFGKKISIYHDDSDDYFRCSVNVQKSMQFYSWLSGFGSDIKLISPDTVRTEYIHYLVGLILSYSNS